MNQKTKQRVQLLDYKTSICHYATFGRNVGYSVDGNRKQSITYDSVTGRIAESDGFAWDYLAGSNLKSQLIYPNEAVVTWSYEPHRDLLTAVTNDTHSAYVYANDLLGRRVFKNDEHYGYNVRNELTSANAVSYAYDDIGNRTVAEGKTYTANNLNQYTQIDGFTPEYDADGNQTLIKTSTGIWSVVYNAENRPVRWQSGDTEITMAFDRMGRRVEMRTVKDGEETLQRFVYDNYLCVQQLRGADNALFHSYVWDPTEPIATRPLIFLPASSSLAYYFHDGNKNVSDLVDIHGSVVHYGYTAFGVAIVSTLSENPVGFSSEFYDISLGLVYYNYRHYNPRDGRWIKRDPLETEIKYSHLFLRNSPLISYDCLGLKERAYITGYVQLRQYDGVFFFDTAKTLFSSSYSFAAECSDDGSSVVFFDQKDGSGYYRFKITNTNDGHFHVLFSATSSGNGTEDFLKSVSLSVGGAVSYETIVAYVTTGTFTGGASLAVVATKAALEAAIVTYVASLDKHDWSILYKKTGNVTCECFINEEGKKEYRPVVSPSKADVRYHKGSELFWGAAWGDFFWDGGTSSSVRR